MLLINEKEKKYNTEYKKGKQKEECRKKVYVHHWTFTQWVMFPTPRLNKNQVQHAMLRNVKENQKPISTKYKRMIWTELMRKTSSPGDKISFIA